MVRWHLTDAEKADKVERKRLAAEQRAIFEAARNRAKNERFEKMPVFVVYEIREVRVKADNGSDAIAIATKAFREGQNEDGSLKWGSPWRIEGNTIEPIQTTNIKAIKEVTD